jgi:hypothetical protein
MTKIIMGTGSRSMLTDPNAVEIYKHLEAHVLHLKELEQDHTIVLISGMAEGWDEAIAKVGERNNIPYHCYIPTKDYGAYYWGRKSLMGIDRLHIFDRLIEGAARVTYLEEIYGEPRFMKRGEIDAHTIAGPNYEVNPGFWLHANMARNSVMVTNSTHDLVYDKDSAGTRDAVAKLRGAKRSYEVYPFKSKLF